MKQFMEIAGRRMAYQDEGQGPALLFGHSYLWDSAMWAPQIEALKEHYRCIVPELWGHGDSDVLPEGPCTLATLAGRWIEARVGQVYPQGWEFYAVLVCLYLTFAFPGFVWRQLRRQHSA
jgi:pimeloyl-ACP methyl ester carboxylesterase